MSPTDPYPMKTLGNQELNGTNGHALAAAAPVAQTPAPLPPALSSPPSFEAVWHILRRRWQLILGLGVAAALVGFAVAWFLTPGKYSTSAILHLSSRNPRSGATETDEFLNFQKTQIQALKSYDVLNRLVAKPEIRELREMQSHEGGEVEWLQKELVVDTQMGPEILRVTLTGDYPEDIEKILNELIPVFIDKFDSEEKSKTVKQIAQLQEALKDRQKETKTKNGAPTPDGPGRDLKTLEQTQQDLQTKLTTLGNQIWLLQREVRGFEEDKAECENKKSKPELLVDEYELRRELNQGEQTRPVRDLIRQKDSELSSLKKMAAKPYTAATKDKIEQLETEIASHQKEIVSGTSGVAASVRELLEKREIVRLNDKIASIEKRISLGKKDVDQSLRDEKTTREMRGEVMQQIYDQRLREQNQHESALAHEKVLGRLTDELSTLTASLSLPSRLEFKERALVPTARKLDKKLKFGAGAAAALFGLVGLGVFLFEFNERRIYSHQDVGRGLGMRVVGTLPYQGPGAKAKDQEQFAMLESCDALRTVLLQAGRNDGVRVVMVTSAGTGEGKTSLSCQLAASLGRGGRRTLLIDGDLRNPAAHKQFNLELAPGFAEALRGEIDPDDAIKPTGVANLSLLPAGQCDPSAIQALAQDELQTLFYHLKEDYEFVIIDVSPVLPVADALVIGQHVDAVLLSVLRDVSKIPLVYDAQQRLAALGIRMLGAVVSGERGQTYGSRPLTAARGASLPLK